MQNPQIEEPAGIPAGPLNAINHEYGVLRLQTVQVSSGVTIPAVWYSRCLRSRPCFMRSLDINGDLVVWKTDQP